MPRSLDSWITLLRATAQPAVPPEFFHLHREVNRAAAPPSTDNSPAPSHLATHAWITAFADDAGHRRDADTPFLSHTLALHPSTNPSPRASELALAWWSLSHPAAFDCLRINIAADGPLLPHLREAGIETWTETELGAMHALLWRGTLQGIAPLIDRAYRTAHWMLDNLQPDNATNHPWAVHLFITMSLDPRRAEPDRTAADLYAQSLLHNAVVHTGRPDRFSALILWDAADFLALPREASAGIDARRRSNAASNLH